MSLKTILIVLLTSAGYFCTSSSSGSSTSNTQKSSGSTSPSDSATGSSSSSSNPSKTVIPHPFGNITGCSFYNLSNTKECSKCGVGYFMKTSTKTCQLCPKTCVSCTNATTCTSCPYGQYLKKDQCLSCQDNCFECEPTATHLKCKTCTDGYVLNPSKTATVNTTDQKEVKSIGYCLRCPKYCDKCKEHSFEFPGKLSVTKMICLKCSSTYTLTDAGQCVNLEFSAFGEFFIWMIFLSLVFVFLMLICCKPMLNGIDKSYQKIKVINIDSYKKRKFQV